MTAASLRHNVLRAFYWGAVVALFLPLGLMALMSLKGGPIVGFPIDQVTVQWYAAAFTDREIAQAFLYSCAVAVASASLALLAGMWTSLAIAGLASPLLRAVSFCAACLPIVTPGIISAISLRMFIELVGLQPGFAAIALGHAAHAAPYVVVIVGLRLRAMPLYLTEAARGLGATEVRTFLHVTLPWLRPAIGAAAVLALLESFDDFLRSFFLGGYRPTLPVLIYGRLFSGLSPEIGAITTMVLLLTVAVGLCGERLLRRIRQDRAASWTD